MFAKSDRVGFPGSLNQIHTRISYANGQHTFLARTERTDRQCTSVGHYTGRPATCMHAHLNATKYASDKNKINKE